MANLFAAANQAVGPKPLVSFRAGKMFKEGNLVKPDKRKGMIQLMHTDDMLIHFQWKDRYTGTVEEDLVIFPDEAAFSRIDKCTTGRVYMLDFKGTSRQLFYWVQEPKDDKDEENCRKINQYMNNPPPFRGGDAPATGGSTSGTGAGGAGGAGGAAGMLGQLDRNQLMGLLAGLSGNAGAGQGAPSAADLAALQSVLQGFGAAVPSGAQAPAAQRPAAASRPQPEVSMGTPISLNHVLDASEISSAIQAAPEDFTNALLEHLPPLPDGVTVEQHLLDNLRSSQLQQTASLFDSALSDPQAFSEIMASFQLQPLPGGPPFGTQAFLDALTHSVAQSRSQGSSEVTKEGAQPMEEVKEGTEEDKDKPKEEAPKDDKMEE